jgi:hypothetical protein
MQATTIGEALGRRSRRAMPFIGAAAFLPVLSFPWVFAGVLSPAVVIVALVASSFFGWRMLGRLKCPRCQAALWSLADRIAFPMMLPPVRMCPHCHVRFDEPYERLNGQT